MSATILQIDKDDMLTLISEARQSTIDWCKKNLTADYPVPEEEVMQKLGVEMSNKIKRREIRENIGVWKRVGKKWVCSAKSIDKWINS